MKKAEIVLSKHVLLTYESSLGEVFKIIHEYPYTTICAAMIKHSTYVSYLKFDERQKNVTKIVNNAAKQAFLAYADRLEEFIPSLADCAGRCRFPFEPTTDVELDVLNLTEKKEDLVIMISFKSQPLILLDSLGDKLLLCFPPAASEPRVETLFNDTFFVTLSDDLSFSSYIKPTK